MVEYLTGVYCWSNRVNRKVYVGGAFVSIVKRLRNYRLLFARGKCHNRHLLHAWDKYGSKAFVFRILERCSPDAVAGREAYWIEKLRATDPEFGYNVCPFGINRKGVRLSAETRHKMSVAKTGVPKGPPSAETKEKIAASKRGVRASAETRAKMSATRKGQKHNDAHRLNAKAAHWSRGPNAAAVAAKIAAGNRGRVNTAKACANISEGRRRQLATR